MIDETFKKRLQQKRERVEDLFYFENNKVSIDFPKNRYL